MALVDQLKADINRALRNGDNLKVETLRGLLAALHNREIELRSKAKELDEEEVISVLGREAKKRKEASQIYTGAGRTDLAVKESKELEIIKGYLPPEMSPDEIELVVKRVIEAGVTDFGQVMGTVVQETKGRAEPSTVKEIVEKILEK